MKTKSDSSNPAPSPTSQEKTVRNLIARGYTIIYLGVGKFGARSKTGVEYLPVER